MSSISIKCSRCNGSGVMPLDAAHDAVLKALEAWPLDKRTAAELSDIFDCKHTTMLMRLNKLESLGLVESIRESGVLQYSIMKG